MDCRANDKEIKMREGLPDRESRDVDWQCCEQKRRETERKKRHATEQNGCDEQCSGQKHQGSSTLGVTYRTIPPIVS
jgi:hypothetical protein